MFYCSLIAPETDQSNVNPMSTVKQTSNGVRQVVNKRARIAGGKNCSIGLCVRVACSCIDERRREAFVRSAPNPLLYTVPALLPVVLPLCIPAPLSTALRTRLSVVIRVDTATRKGFGF